MMELVAVHTFVELDPEPQQEIERWRERLSRASDDEREDIQIRLRRYETDDEIIVRITITLELAGDEGSEQRPGPAIAGVWFGCDDRAGNGEHATQLAIERIRGNLDELTRNGVHQRTVGLPVILEYDEAVEVRLGLEKPGRLPGR